MTFCINLQKAIVYFCQILFDLLKIGYILLLWGFGIFVFFTSSLYILYFRAPWALLSLFGFSKSRSTAEHSDSQDIKVRAGKMA